MGVSVAAVALTDLVTYLDGYLDLAGVPDYPDAWNGLQVENSGKVEKIAACTDACQATFEAAAARGADLLLVHHGLFWGKGVTPLTDRRYHRVRQLITADIALYSAHLPLDAHPEVGNNIELARGIGLAVEGGFGEYEGHATGFWGELQVSRGELSTRLEKLLESKPFLIPAGPEEVRRLGVVTGGGGGILSQAHDAGLDTFVTGEGPHHSYFDAQEWGLNVFFAGHYATETLGVKALARHLAEKFGLDWEFIDHPTGL
jgi:dinuclear metal center YbgI/SA1388 family protein